MKLASSPERSMSAFMTHQVCSTERLLVVTGFAFHLMVVNASRGFLRFISAISCSLFQVVDHVSRFCWEGRTPVFPLDRLPDTTAPTAAFIAARLQDLIITPARRTVRQVNIPDDYPVFPLTCLTCACTQCLRLQTHRTLK